MESQGHQDEAAVNGIIHGQCGEIGIAAMKLDRDQITVNLPAKCQHCRRDIRGAMLNFATGEWRAYS
jgi:hypothetical protein